MVGESNQNVFLVQKDASNFAEFDLSEFEISRFDCIYINTISMCWFALIGGLSAVYVVFPVNSLLNPEM